MKRLASPLQPGRFSLKEPRGYITYLRYLPTHKVNTPNTFHIPSKFQKVDTILLIATKRSDCTKKRTRFTFNKHQKLYATELLNLPTPSTHFVLLSFPVSIHFESRDDCTLQLKFENIRCTSIIWYY